MEDKHRKKVTITEAAEYLGLTRGRVQDMVERGVLKADRFAGAIHIPRERWSASSARPPCETRTFASHPAPRLHQRRLSCRMRSLQAEPQGGVLRAGKPVGSVSLQRRELSDQPREVAGRLPGYALRALRTHL